MTSIRIRPRFKKELNIPVNELEQKINSALKNTDKFSYSSDPGHIVVRIQSEDRHFWSPQLSMSFEEVNEKLTVLRGLYGPSPNVWTIFMLLYLGIAVLTLFALFLAASYYFLGQDIKIIWSLPILAILALIVYLIAQFGQKLGAEETFRLNQFIEGAIGEEMHVE